MEQKQQQNSNIELSAEKYYNENFNPVEKAGIAKDWFINHLTRFAALFQSEQKEFDAHIGANKEGNHLRRYSSLICSSCISGINFKITEGEFIRFQEMLRNNTDNTEQKPLDSVANYSETLSSVEQLEDFNDLEEIIWSTEIIFDSDIEYALKTEAKTNEPELWEEIKKEASKVSDNPGFDYGIPDWVFFQFISDLEKKYSIVLK